MEMHLRRTFTAPDGVLLLDGAASVCGSNSNLAPTPPVGRACACTGCWTPQALESALAEIKALREELTPLRAIKKSAQEYQQYLDREIKQLHEILQDRNFASVGSELQLCQSEYGLIEFILAGRRSKER
jgi:hypothetical protein